MKLTTTLLSFLLLSGALALGACGDSDGGALPVGDGGGSGGSDIAMSTGDMAGAPGDGPVMNPGDGPCYGGPKAACATCLKANCNAEVTGCFGAAWQTMDSPSSVCSGVFACTCTCVEKGGMSCEPKCVMERGGSCGDCFMKATACAASRCAQECK